MKGQSNCASRRSSRICPSSRPCPAISPTCRRWWRRSAVTARRGLQPGRDQLALGFNQAELTANVTGLGVLILEAIRMAGGTQNNPIRFYQASSSEMFARCARRPRTKRHRSTRAAPTGAPRCSGTTSSSTIARVTTCRSGIPFNHEGPRGIEFVTRKVTNAVARIKLGLQHGLVLGNLDSKRDWGYAGDYVAMWLMLQQDQPEDYVIATGETHSIEEFVERAFGEVGIDDWRKYVRQDPKFFRPGGRFLIGTVEGPREARWRPEVDFDARQHDGAARPRARGQESWHRVRRNPVHVALSGASGDSAT